MKLKKLLGHMKLKKLLRQMRRNSIVLDIAGKGEYKLGGTRFGGQPDVPPNFVWPTFAEKGIDDTAIARPLVFLAQFDCSELSQFDSEHLLPDCGVLSFFYDADSQPWGFAPEDEGAARVFWFENTSALSAADFPEDMGDDFKSPMLHISIKQEPSLPGWEDFAEAYSNVDDEAFEAAREELGAEEPNERSKLLGWPDVIQNSIAVECELVAQGYYPGNDGNHISNEIRQRAQETALNRWLLLFQLDVVEDDGFCLMFGDCGRLYFYILKEDLLARRFDRACFTLQCY